MRDAVRKMVRALTAIAAALLLCGTAACDSIDDKRLPAVPVNVTFNTPAMWNTYGVSGALDTRRFILTRFERVPHDFPYAATTSTGFGGILLVCDYYGNPLAYDLACPVEARSDVRVEVDNESLLAECPVCHSTYAIFENFGHPMSGIAAERGYGLQRYQVVPGRADYMVITR